MMLHFFVHTFVQCIFIFLKRIFLINSLKYFIKYRWTINAPHKKKRKHLFWKHRGLQSTELIPIFILCQRLDQSTTKKVIVSSAFSSPLHNYMYMYISFLFVIHVYRTNKWIWISYNIYWGWTVIKTGWLHWHFIFNLHVAWKRFTRIIQYHKSWHEFWPSFLYSSIVQLHVQCNWNSSPHVNMSSWFWTKKSLKIPKGGNQNPLFKGQTKTAIRKRTTFL
jgi:hypothetical protein